jgi:PAS domain S-box-containing protein
MKKNNVADNGIKEKNGNSKKEIEELREKIRELEETLDAIRSGEVDAIVVSKGDTQQVYTLEGADHPYRALVENIREGALTLSRDGMILYTNSRFAEMVKIPADKIPGTSLLKYVCPEHCADMEEALREIIRKSCRTRLRLRQGKKESLPVLISMNPLDHGDDTKISVVVTDRRKDEDRIILQARMLDSVGDAVIAADINNKIVYWNIAATKTYGWTPEEVIGHDLIDVATPEISKKEAKEIADRISKGETWTGEYVVKHRDGREFPIYASDAPVFDDDGKLIAIIGASHDITEWKKAEEALRESEGKYRNLFTNMQEGFYLAKVIFKDSIPVDYLYLEVNPAFETMMGRNKDQLVGRTAKEILPGINPVWAQILGNVIQTGKPAQHEEYSENLKRHFEANVFRRNDGEVAVLVTDITSRKIAENDLKRNNEELKAVNEELTATQEELHFNIEELSLREQELLKRETELKESLSEKEVLLSEIHHRVKNNLTAFISLLSLEGSYEDNEEGRALRKDLQNRARSMALIHETLYRTGKFSKVDMGVYLNNLVDQIASSYGSRKDILIDVKVEKVSLEIARATTAGLIINELVTNSFKYAFPSVFDCMAVRGENCMIRVLLSHVDGINVLTVADNGIGFPEKFDPLISKSLGLKLVNFLSRHQLRAEIEVRRDKGTEFIFRLKNVGNIA